MVGYVAGDFASFVQQFAVFAACVVAKGVASLLGQGALCFGFPGQITTRGGRKWRGCMLDVLDYEELVNRGL